MRERPVLSDDQRVRLATACLENALNLLRESEIFVNNGALPYAQFLLGSAWEEVLKARYCVDEGGTWKKWWDGFRDHKTKLDLARGVLAESSPGLDQQAAQLPRAVPVCRSQGGRKPPNTSWLG
jgi:AbiV family abortive infection protein